MHAAFLLALLIFPTKFSLDNYSGMTGATMRWAEYVTDMGHETNTGLLLSEPEENRSPLGRPRSKLQNIIKTDPELLQWRGWGRFRIKAILKSCKYVKDFQVP